MLYAIGNYNSVDKSAKRCLGQLFMDGDYNANKVVAGHCLLFQKS